MQSGPDLHHSNLAPNLQAPDLQRLVEQIWAIAQEQQGDSLALLEILRMLENLHRQICEGPFQDSLPNNRQALYNLLKDIEAQGGWPYIPRMKIQRLLTTVLADNAHPAAESP
jgi:hypothetical protein